MCTVLSTFNGVAFPVASRRRRGRRLLSFGLVGLCRASPLFAIATAPLPVVSAFDDSDPSKWYTRYPSYPEQCSTPAQMRSRSIPPLSNDPKAGGVHTRLRHVTAIFRHGARSAHPGKNCWKGYRTSVETSRWDCNLTSVEGISGTTLGFATGEDDGDDSAGPGPEPGPGPGPGPGLLVERRYDAFDMYEGKYYRRNDMGGTCASGQLLARGAAQGRTLGGHLRNAYTYNSDGEDSSAEAAHDERMRLLRRDNWDEVSKDIYVRSDEYQRTIMTAHAVLTGLLGPDAESFARNNNGKPPPPAIPLHLAEQENDVFLPQNEQGRCKRLRDIMSKAKQWDRYIQFSESELAKTTNRFMKHEVPLLWDDPNECLMSAMCADLGIPEVIDDYDRPEEDEGSKSETIQRVHKKYGKDILRRVVDSDVIDWVMRWQYNDGEYAKVNMGPVWAEIMDNVRPACAAASASAIDDNSDKDTDTNTKKMPKLKNKMALFSAHDSTIIQLLIALGKDVWDGKWTPYAGAMIIEIHELIETDDDSSTIDRALYTTNYAFRLVYNGKVLTSKLGGCPPDADLCDSRILLDRVRPFATFRPDCTRLTEEEEEELEEGDDEERRARRRRRMRMRMRTQSAGGERRSPATPDDESFGNSNEEERATEEEGRAKAASGTTNFVAVLLPSALAGAVVGSFVTVLIMTVTTTANNNP